MKSKVTPGSFAKEWASSHPDFTGKLTISSLTPKGLGGRRGFALRENGFWIAGGKAAAERGYYQTNTHNGLCEACGKVYLEVVLKMAWAPDPNAGEPVERDDAQHWQRWENRRAQFAHVTACPSCVTDHGLITVPRNIAEPPSAFSALVNTNERYDQERKIRYFDRAHPVLAQKWQIGREVIDIREVQFA